MKVLHLETGTHMYGGAMQVLYLLKGLSKRGIHNILVCPRNSEIALEADPYVRTLYPVSMRGDLDLPFIFRFYKILQRERPDIIHLHSRRGADTLGGIGARLYGKAKVVLTRRVDNPERPFLVKMKYSLYDRIITISEAIRQVLLREGVPEEKTATVRSAIDTEQLYLNCHWQWFKDEFALKDGDYPVGMVAQFIKRKGHRYLIEIAGEIVKIHPNVRFLLFGKGPLEEDVKQQVHKRGLSEYFRFCGFRKDIKRVYPCLKLLVHPAEMEGLGVSLIEATGSGVPVVAFSAGGVPEIVRDGQNGFVVPIGDIDGLKSAILRLIKDESLRKEMGQQGKAIVQKKFSMDAMVEGNLRVYREILRWDH